MTSTSGKDIDLGLAAAMVCICVLGVMMNLLVILVLALNRNMRASTDLFVVNLSVSDILLAGLALPLKINTALYADGDFHGGKYIYIYISVYNKYKSAIAAPSV